MAKARGDDRTMDLLSDWTPPKVAERFEEETVKGTDDAMRMARAISQAIRDSGLSRDEIHARMTAHMGRDFGRHYFDRITAPAAAGYEFNVSKLIAFLHAVPDLRLINELLEGTGFVAIPEKYLGAIEEAICEDQIERMMERKRLARRTWRSR